MPRPPAKCGTRTGYRKHLREKTPPCEECKKANSEYKTTNKKAAEDKRREEIKQSLTHLQPEKTNVTQINKNQTKTNNDNDIDPRIADLKENLAFIKNAFFIATPKELPALSKRRQELEEEIYRLTHNTDEKQTIADKLAQIRTYRKSAT